MVRGRPLLEAFAIVCKHSAADSNLLSLAVDLLEPGAIWVWPHCCSRCCKLEHSAYTQCKCLCLPSSHKLTGVVKTWF